MCIFCDIIERKKESRILYEDEEKIAILDAFPVTEGHALIIPKKHFENYRKIPEKVWGSLFSLSRKTAALCEKELSCQGVNICTAPAAIPHFHIHVIPRYDYDLMGPLADLDNKRERSKKIMDDVYDKLKKGFEGK